LFLLRSKTLIFNGLLLLGGLFIPNLSDAIRGIIISTAITNIGLRLKTKLPVKEKDKGSLWQ